MDIYSLIFYQILKYDPSSTFLTGNMVHDLVFGVLIPSIAVIIILRIFSSYIVGKNGDLQILAIIGGLAFIIFGGWFPIIAQLYIPLFGLALFLQAIKVFTTHLINEKGQEALKDFTLDMMSKSLRKQLYKLKPYESEAFRKYYTLCYEQTQKKMEKNICDKKLAETNDSRMKQYLTSKSEELTKEIWGLETERIAVLNEMMRIFGQRHTMKLVQKINDDVMAKVKEMRKDMEKEIEEELKQFRK